MVKRASALKALGIIQGDLESRKSKRREYARKRYERTHGRLLSDIFKRKRVIGKTIHFKRPAGGGWTAVAWRKKLSGNYRKGNAWTSALATHKRQQGESFGTWISRVKSLYKK